MIGSAALRPLRSRRWPTRPLMGVYAIGAGNAGLAECELKTQIARFGPVTILHD